MRHGKRAASCQCPGALPAAHPCSSAEEGHSVRAGELHGASTTKGRHMRARAGKTHRGAGRAKPSNTEPSKRAARALRSTCCRRRSGGGPGAPATGFEAVSVSQLGSPSDTATAVVPPCRVINGIPLRSPTRADTELAEALSGVAMPPPVRRIATALSSARRLASAINCRAVNARAPAEVEVADEVRRHSSRGLDRLKRRPDTQ